MGCVPHLSKGAAYISFAVLLHHYIGCQQPKGSQLPYYRCYTPISSEAALVFFRTLVQVSVANLYKQRSYLYVQGYALYIVQVLHTYTNIRCIHLIYVYTTYTHRYILRIYLYKQLRYLYYVFYRTHNSIYTTYIYYVYILRIYTYRLATLTYILGVYT